MGRVVLFGSRKEVHLNEAYYPRTLGNGARRSWDIHCQAKQFRTHPVKVGHCEFMRSVTRSGQDVRTRTLWSNLQKWTREMKDSGRQPRWTICCSHQDEGWCSEQMRILAGRRKGGLWVPETQWRAMGTRYLDDWFRRSREEWSCHGEWHLAF